jgi:phage-related protein
MKASEIVLYKGSAFTIEWYFDERGNCAAREYYERLSMDRRVQLLKLVRLMGEVGKIFDTTKFRNEGDQVFAFKPQPDRYLCFFVTGKKIVITNAFEKKSQKLPPGEKARALKAKSDFEARIKRGTYYEKER